MAKKFKYPVQFNTVDSFQFKDQTVKGFKAESSEQKEEVQSYYYEGKNEFMVKISTDKPKEGVFLLRTDYQSAKVSEIIEHVISWESQPTTAIAYNEPFIMPVLDLDYYREMTQVQGVNLANEDFTDYRFGKVFEALKLKMDEKGVTVENEGGMIMVGSAAFEEPNQYILDDTFWIVLKEEGKHPYLCAKINEPVENQEM